MTKETGGHAFPTDKGILVDAFPGMSLRDHYAGLAMQAKMASSLPNEIPDAVKGSTVGQWIAQQAFFMADAMIQERNKP